MVTKDKWSPVIFTWDDSLGLKRLHVTAAIRGCRFGFPLRPGSGVRAGIKRVGVVRVLVPRWGRRNHLEEERVRVTEWSRWARGSNRDRTSKAKWNDKPVPLDWRLGSVGYYSDQTPESRLWWVCVWEKPLWPAEQNTYTWVRQQ